MKKYKHSLPLPLVGKLYDQMIRVVRHEEKEKPQNIILYVGRVYNHMIDAVRAYEKKEKKTFRIGILSDSRTKIDKYTEASLDRIDVVLSCDLNSSAAIQKTLAPYQKEILVATCRSEGSIPHFANVIPQVPYVDTPTTESLMWSSEKLLMRERLSNHDKNLSPAYQIISKHTKESIKKLEDEVGYPMVVKPTGLAGSILVSLCYHREELEQSLTTVFKKIEQLYKEKQFSHDPQILVEHFMEGEQYSVDAYINARGKITFCPMVFIKTGKGIGFDDFFGYMQMTPTRLSKESIAEAEKVATETIYALGLRSTTAHIEFLKTEQGWKIIEAGARVGGFRHMLYEFSHDINHTMNDILNRGIKKVDVPKSVKGFSAAMKFYGREQGKLKSIGGIKKAEDLKSFKRIYINKQIGDQLRFAKNGGASVFNIILFNKDRSKLLADIRRLETMINIEIE